MRLDARWSPEPDLMVILNDRLHRMTPSCLEGPATSSSRSVPRAIRNSTNARNSPATEPPPSPRSGLSIRSSLASTSNRQDCRHRCSRKDGSGRLPSPASGSTPGGCGRRSFPPR
jgi:hypothetical protein